MPSVYLSNHVILLILLVSLKQLISTLLAYMSIWDNDHVASLGISIIYQYGAMVIWPHLVYINYYQYGAMIMWPHLVYQSYIYMGQ